MGGHDNSLWAGEPPVVLKAGNPFFCGRLPDLLPPPLRPPHPVYILTWTILEFTPSHSSSTISFSNKITCAHSPILHHLEEGCSDSMYVKNRVSSFTRDQLRLREVIVVE